MGCAESVPVKNDQDNPHEPPQEPRLQAELDETESVLTNITLPPAAALPMSMRRFTAAVEMVAKRHGFKFCLSSFTACKIIKALMDKQKEFERKSVSTRVTVGYHYTKSENLWNIQVRSLLTSGKGFYGKGLYTANNPGAFSNYGSTGLVCAILKGLVGRIETKGMDQCTTIDTGVGNKAVEELLSLDSDDMVPLYHDENVLRSQQQCVPLISYNARTDVLSDVFFARLQACQTDLERVLDHFFNNATPTPSQRIAWPLDQGQDPFRYPASTLLTVPIRLQSPVFTVRTTGWIAGQEQHDFSLPAIFPYTAPRQLLSSRAPCYNKSFTFLTQAELQTTGVGDDCPLCTIPSRCGEVIKLLKCKHSFHRLCLLSSLEKCSTCPTCQQDVAELYSASPSGIMSLKGMNKSCAGYETSLTAVIEYRIRGGTQEAYHPNPGVAFSTTTRTAYVPYCDEGWHLLKRLIWAFQHGLTFRIGTSQTTGHSNVVTWSSIPHKTLRIEGGEHGFPDSAYLTNCNTELTRLGVPSADELEEAGMMNSNRPTMLYTVV